MSPLDDESTGLRPPSWRPPRLRSRVWLGLVGVALLILVLARAVSAEGRQGDELVAAGRFFHTGTPVVLWTDPGGYDAYQRRKHFATEEPPDGELRYQPVRADLPTAIAERVAAGGWRLEDLQQVVHLFVLHFDVAGTSRKCFKILQDDRRLSVHFLLDTDGTIYQTLDLQEQAWHATIANKVSIGVEIAHPGSWTRPRHPEMMRWYDRDEAGWYMKFPVDVRPTGLRTEGFLPRPDRPEVIGGTIHGTQYFQLDYTPEQYRALAHLIAALHLVFPRIRIDAPRNPDGTVRTTWLPPEQLLAFEGVVGHFHVQKNKSDPGPALQWERLLADARALLLDDR